MLTKKEFSDLYDRYIDDVAAFLYSYASGKAQLKDWIQEVFTKLWEARGQIDFKHPFFKSYLLTTARNHALSQLRKEKKYDAWLEQNLKRLTRNPSSQDDLVIHPPDILEAYRSALSQIPSRSCQAYMLSREDGLTYPEIAKVMEISVKTVEAHISKALQVLRNELKDEPHA